MGLACLHFYEIEFHNEKVIFRNRTAENAIKEWNYVREGYHSMVSIELYFILNK